MILTEPLITTADSEECQSETEENHQDVKEALSPNVPIALGFTGLAFVSRSLWNQNVLAMFLYKISSHDPRCIGYVTSIMGLLQLISSFPGGYFADKYRRDIVIRSSAIIGIVSILMVITSVALKNLWLVGGAYAIVGIYWGLTTTSISALYADSLRDEERPKYITWRYTTQKLGNMAAPIIAILMFAHKRNHWSEDDCADILYCSQAIGVLSVLLPCFMSDDKIVQKSNSSNETDIASSDGSSMSEQMEEGEESRQLIGFDVELSFNSEKSEEPYDYIIPLCLCSADILQAFANGMSVQYFPVFFSRVLHIRPIFVQIVYLCSQSCQACGGIFGGKLGKYFGRSQTACCLRILGASVLFLMVLAAHLEWGPVCVCIFYVLRMTLTNSTVPLTGSTLMDYVPKHHRGKWSSLDSIVKAGWSGSAFIGGFLIHKFGIYSVFYVTIVLQVIATIPLVFLFKKVDT